MPENTSKARNSSGKSINASRYILKNSSLLVLYTGKPVLGKWTSENLALRSTLISKVISSKSIRTQRPLWNRSQSYWSAQYCRRPLSIFGPGWKSSRDRWWANIDGSVPIRQDAAYWRQIILKETSCEYWGQMMRWISELDDVVGDVLFTGRETWCMKCQMRVPVMKKQGTRNFSVPPNPFRSANLKSPVSPAIKILGLTCPSSWINSHSFIHSCCPDQRWSESLYLYSCIVP